MRGKLMMYRDQYGTVWYANSVKELRKQVGMGGSRVSKMYVDKKDGRTVHIGYVVGSHWCSAYVPLELPA